MQSVAGAWLVLQLSHNSALALALFGAFSYGPVLLFGLYAGTIVDRFAHRDVLLLTQVVSVLGAVLYAALTATHDITLPIVMVLAAILTTIAIGILLRGLIVLIWSAAQQHPLEALHFSNPSLEVFGGARVSACAALMVVMTAVVYGGLFAFLRFGRWGVRMRAAGQNPLLAAQRGVNLNAVYALAWGLSSLSGSIAGMLIALDSGLDQTMVVIGLKAFAPALVGGLDSLVGALVGSLIVAAAEVLAIHYIDPLLSDVVPFLVLIAMLIVRPWGLFGTREELDRV